MVLVDRKTFRPGLEVRIGSEGNACTFGVGFKWPAIRFINKDGFRRWQLIGVTLGESDPPWMFYRWKAIASIGPFWVSVGRW